MSSQLPIGAAKGRLENDDCGTGSTRTYDYDVKHHICEGRNSDSAISRVLYDMNVSKSNLANTYTIARKLIRQFVNILKSCDEWIIISHKRN
jgi:hypothetical protein